MKLSLLFLFLLAFLSIAAPWVTPYAFDQQSIAERLQSPSWSHWMGTDSLGRDLFTRILYGARISLGIGFTTSFIALVFGTILGLLSGFLGHHVDRFIMKTADFLYIFPGMLLAILLMTVLGRGTFALLVALSITSWITQMRLIRGHVLHLKGLSYIEAARSTGASTPHILIHHILPHLWEPSLISLGALVPANMMTESFLSFMGLGIQPPYASWGTLAQEGFRTIQSYPHLILFSGGALFFSSLALSIVVERFRKDFSEVH